MQCSATVFMALVVMTLVLRTLLFPLALIFVCVRQGFASPKEVFMRLSYTSGIRSECRSARNVINISLSRRFISFVLLLSFIILPAPGLADQLASAPALAVEITAGSMRMAFSMFGALFGFNAAPARQDTMADRAGRVSNIHISPNKFVAYLKDSISFAAMATDASGQVVQGVKFNWESDDPSKIQIDDSGRASFLKPGVARISCSAGSAQSSTKILIRPSRRSHQSDDQWRNDQ